ncbi:hypothetical protein F5878DRAFT_666623 [Lentinula raphanica]|uniref:Uncharacterized protein n=1 Tax=Lentinula raphanica TaxID=153919 RepID=A0AA38NXC6_9AGAR|nr:hypothetical protein F5878DRAFT_666623 [Lentinula raphanica]
MVSQLPTSISDVLPTIRMKAGVNGEGSTRGIVQQVLETDGNIRHALEDWIGQNISTTVSQQKYPDKGAVFNILCNTMLAVVNQDEYGVKQVLEVYETMLTELKDDYLPMARPRNLFELNGSISANFNTDADDRRLDMSDLSDLTDLSDTEDEDEDKREREREREHQTSSKSGQETSTTGGDGIGRRMNEEYEKCVERAFTWKEALTRVIGLTAEDDVEAKVTAEVVGAIRAMKKIPKKEYGTENFRSAIKGSGLGEAIGIICDPLFTISNRHEQILRLAHVYRIGDQLAEILEKWTPKEVVETWVTESTRFRASENGGQPIVTPKDFIEAFNIEEDYVPGAENLSYCFFMTSLGNFKYNYDIWLGRLLEYLEYDVSAWNDEKELEKFYGRLIWQIHEWCTQPQQTYDGETKLAIDVKVFKNPRWKALIKHTAALRQVAKETSSHARKLSRCTECRDQPASERCCRYIYKPHITTGLSDDEAVTRMEVLRDEMTGAGVTMVPEHERVQPKISTDCKRRQPAGTGRLYHPDSIASTSPFKLEELQPDESILERCGHQLLLVLNEAGEGKKPEDTVVDWKTLRREEIKDFMWWRPFDQVKLALLQDAVVDSTGVQPVTRGGQFQSFLGGKMTPIGSRSPSGGRAGDSYTSYSGLEAMTEAGLDVLFKQAAISVMMQVHPKLASEIKRISGECDRVGMTGANIYDCVGYMAPIHQDRDATRGLCSQALLSADERYREFAFCNIEYQYYMVTSTNCLWSFKSSNLHGTMLPSLTTISNLNSHAIDPQRQPTVVPTQTGRSGSLWEYTSQAQKQPSAVARREGGQDDANVSNVAQGGTLKALQVVK